MSFLHLFCYLSLAAFLVAVSARALRLARLPLHLRWELYPVPHERGRARYGGSYLEEPEWWARPRRRSLPGTLAAMIPEILLLAGVRKHNRSQWIRALPFHLGLYLLAGTTLLLVLGGILGQRDAGGFFGTAIPLLGHPGLALGLAGSVALLLRRTLDEEYRDYTTPADLLNLLLFVVAFAVGLLAHLTSDPDFLEMRGFFAGLLSSSAESFAPIQSLEVVLFAFLVAYVPATHMSHFFTKWFIYHGVRWDDEPLRPGGGIDRRVRRALELRPTWAAPHVGADGERTWMDVAAAPGLPEEEGRGGAA